MSKVAKNVVIVSLGTLTSRVIGLLRDIIAFSLMGTSVIHSAFIFAYTLPNLFRRLLGEGALSSALVPLLTESHEKEGEEKAFHFLNEVLSWAFVVLFMVSLICMGVLGGIQASAGEDNLKWYYGGKLGVILFPYVIFVCLAALIGGALNVIGRFGISAMSQVWLNLAMIATMVLGGWWAGEDDIQKVNWMCAGVLIGGVLQIAIPAIWLMKRGWRPRLSLKVSPRMKEVLLIMLPGFGGAAMMQLNVVVSRLLAFGLNDYAAAVMYLANRLIEFPLGLFVITITTVLFPQIARAVVKGDEQGVKSNLNRGLIAVLGISIPAAVGLIVLDKPILESLFQWGKFDENDVALTAPVLMTFTLGLPFYAMSTLLIRIYHARKDMKKPFHVALVCFGTNLIFSLFLMAPLGVMGLAWANFITSIIQAGLLLGGLNVEKSYLVKNSLKIVFSALVMGIIVGYLGEGLNLFDPEQPKRILVSGLALAIFAGILIYTALLWILKVDKLRTRKLSLGLK